MTFETHTERERERHTHTHAQSVRSEGLDFEAYFTPIESSVKVA